jgi:hypothetical protein
MAGITLYDLTTDDLLSVLEFAHSKSLKIDIPTAYMPCEDILPDGGNADLIYKTFVDLAKERIFPLPLAKTVDILSIIDPLDDKWSLDNDTILWILQQSQLHGIINAEGKYTYKA